MASVSRDVVSSAAKTSPSFPEPDSASPFVAVCEPDPSRLARLVKELDSGLAVAHECDLAGLARLCSERAPSAVALPLHGLGPAPGLMRFIREHAARLPVLVYADTGRLPIGVYSAPLAAGARRVLNDQSPTFYHDLARTLQRVVSDQRASAEEQERLAGRFAEYGLVGRSTALREVFRRAFKAACFGDLPVLILGETGTGKQRLVEAIHGLDPRRGQHRCVTVNCGSISKNLAESELFGHVKGSFSGANGDRLGLFRAADGGTLVLDEIGELDPELQPKLLRVLQERRLLPVGEDYERPIDVRVIALTNRPLEQMVAEGRFRADLYQRLNVFQVRVPPLRERREDVAVQARHFLRLHQPPGPRRVADFDPLVLEALERLPWEGNTRQLENFVRETLVRKDRGGVVCLEDLPGWVLEALAAEAGGHADGFGHAEASPEEAGEAVSLNEALAAYERRLLQRELQRNGGNRTRTAARLGLTVRSVFNKIKKHQLG